MPCPTIIHLPFTCQKITTIHLEGLIAGNQTLHPPESLTYMLVSGFIQSCSQKQHWRMLMASTPKGDPPQYKAYLNHSWGLGVPLEVESCWIQQPIPYLGQSQAFCIRDLPDQPPVQQHRLRTAGRIGIQHQPHVARVGIRVEHAVLDGHRCGNIEMSWLEGGSSCFFLQVLVFGEHILLDVYM